MSKRRNAKLADKALRDGQRQWTRETRRSIPAVRKAIDSIDWELLRKQKEWLVNTGLPHGSADFEPEAEGLLALLDSVMDAVVEDCIASEREVFGDEMIGARQEHA